MITTGATLRDLTGVWQHRTATPDRFIWGPGTHVELRNEVERLGGSRVLLLTSGSLARHTHWVERVRDALGTLVVGVRSDSQEFTPDWLCFDTANKARPVRPDIVVTLGGGSVADWGKAVCFVLAQGLHSVDELDQYVASPQDQQLAGLRSPPIPQIALPTTLSGSESSWSVTINRPQRRFKDHVRHPSLTPRVLIYDAEIAASTPKQLWSATGLKAMEHAVEKLYTVDGNPIVDALCLRAAELLQKNLLQAHRNPGDLAALTGAQLALMMCVLDGRGVHKGLSQVGVSVRWSPW